MYYVIVLIKLKLWIPISAILHTQCCDHSAKKGSSGKIGNNPNWPIYWLYLENTFHMMVTLFGTFLHIHLRYLPDTSNSKLKIKITIESPTKKNILLESQQSPVRLKILM